MNVIILGADGLSTGPADAEDYGKNKKKLKQKKNEGNLEFGGLQFGIGGAFLQVGELTLVADPFAADHVQDGLVLALYVVRFDHLLANALNLRQRRFLIHHLRLNPIENAERPLIKSLPAGRDERDAPLRRRMRNVPGSSRRSYAEVNNKIKIKYPSRRAGV